ncbi:putative ABC-type transport system involved in resistance to organic solvents, auxiliary component [uncultured Alphaproteobacteria bacterium]|uniref:Putative ABC-type transport system involved in resistance to organic solvents, auxiliary component n=1 Tax=uncultured Alphaproteobacteria bacterium TaxID=91750 RepID=A0A212JL44_9PROT|nr:putative ABC-type transport system involved in resistance to organic solvents, auxiliary component [uncultured Alphaproteobacteria bacterium]
MLDAFRRAAPALRSAALALLLLVPGAAHAAPTEQATKFVAKLVDTAINDVIGAQISDAQREERFRELFVEAADIPGIAAFVVGREWRGASEAKKKEFIQLFEDVSILTWISHLDEYSDVRIQVTGAYQDKSDVFVESQVQTSSGKPIPIVWRVQERQGGQLKLIDVVIEANSMLINTRKQYASVMRREGGLDGLMTALSRMRDDLRAGKQPAPLPEN